MNQKWPYYNLACQHHEKDAFSVPNFEIKEKSYNMNKLQQYIAQNKPLPNDNKIKLQCYHGPDQQQNWRNYLLECTRQQWENVSNKSIAGGNMC